LLRTNKCRQAYHFCHMDALISIYCIWIDIPLITLNTLDYSRLQLGYQLTTISSKSRSQSAIVLHNSLTQYCWREGGLLLNIIKNCMKTNAKIFCCFFRESWILNLESTHPHYGRLFHYTSRSPLAVLWAKKVWSPGKNNHTWFGEEIKKTLKMVVCWSNICTKRMNYLYLEQIKRKTIKKTKSGSSAKK